MHLIFKHQVPPKRKVKYSNFACDYRSLKPEPWRVRLVVGGDKVDYFEDVGSPTTTLSEIRIFINTVIYDSPKGARFTSLDLQDFFLCSTMPICWLSSSLALLVCSSISLDLLFWSLCRRFWCHIILQKWRQSSHQHNPIQIWLFHRLGRKIVLYSPIWLAIPETICWCLFTWLCRKITTMPPTYSAIIPTIFSTTSHLHPVQH